MNTSQKKLRSNLQKIADGLSFGTPFCITVEDQLEAEFEPVGGKYKCNWKNCKAVMTKVQRYKHWQSHMMTRFARLQHQSSTCKHCK